MASFACTKMVSPTPAATRASFLADAPDAYERLLMDCMHGDPTLFSRSDGVETAWEFIDPIEARWNEGEPPLVTYPAGSWGPGEADEMLERDRGRFRFAAKQAEPSPLGAGGGGNVRSDQAIDRAISAAVAPLVVQTLTGPYVQHV